MSIARPACGSCQSCGRGVLGGIKTYRARREDELQVRQGKQVPVPVVRGAEISETNAHAEDDGRRHQRHAANDQ